MPVPSYAVPSAYLIDVGVITVGGKTAVVSATVGGLKWSPGAEVRHVQFDGLRHEIQLQHRNTGGSPVLSGKVLSSSDANVIRMHPGSSSDGSTMNTITPLAANTFWVAGDYLTDVYYIGRRQDGKAFMVHMPKAYIRKAEVATTDKNESGWDVEIVPVLASTETDLAKVPYTYEVET